MFGSELRCKTCNQYFPDRCTCVFKSNAQWPLDTYRGEYGDGISTDTHNSKEAAESICRVLEERGFGGEGKVFPLKTWVGEPR